MKDKKLFNNRSIPGFKDGSVHVEMRKNILQNLEMENNYTMERIDYEFNRVSIDFPMRECIIEIVRNILRLMNDNIIVYNDYNSFPTDKSSNIITVGNNIIIIYNVYVYPHRYKNVEELKRFILDEYKVFNVNNISIEDLKDFKIDVEQIYNLYKRTAFNYNLRTEMNEKLILSYYKDKKLPLVIQELSDRTITNTDMRFLYIKYFSYTAVTRAFIDNLAMFLQDKRCLEIMAGQGCLSYFLQEEGINIHPTDNASWELDTAKYWTDIEIIDCLDAIRKYGKDIDYIIIGWTPPNDDIINKVFDTIWEVNPDLEIIFIGEENECTGTYDMFDNIEYIEDERFELVQQSYTTWYSLHDYPMLLKVVK